MYSVTKSFHFDYGHRVLGHKGKCQYLHGHHGVAEVTLQSVKLDALGMVFDFGEMKGIFGKWLDLHWDHNLLLNPSDPVLEYLLEKEKRPPYVMQATSYSRGGDLTRYPQGGNPTAEAMARELYEATHVLLPLEVDVVRIRIYETPTSWADYIPENT